MAFQPDDPNFYLSNLVATMDAPVILQASETGIPGNGSDTLQVVAQLDSEINRIEYTDGIGRFVGVFIGPEGEEEQVGCISGSAKGFIEQWIPGGTRISLRNLENDEITTGSLYMEFRFVSIRRGG